MAEARYRCLEATERKVKHRIPVKVVIASNHPAIVNPVKADLRFAGWGAPAVESAGHIRTELLYNLEVEADERDPETIVYDIVVTRSVRVRNPENVDERTPKDDGSVGGSGGGEYRSIIKGRKKRRLSRD